MDKSEVEKFLDMLEHVNMDAISENLRKKFREIEIFGEISDNSDNCAITGCTINEVTNG